MTELAEQLEAAAVAVENHGWPNLTPLQQESLSELLKVAREAAKALTPTDWPTVAERLLTAQKDGPEGEAARAELKAELEQELGVSLDPAEFYARNLFPDSDDAFTWDVRRSAGIGHKDHVIYENLDEATARWVTDQYNAGHPPAPYMVGQKRLAARRKALKS